MSTHIIRSVSLLVLVVLACDHVPVEEATGQDSLEVDPDETGMTTAAGVSDGAETTTAEPSGTSRETGTEPIEASCLAEDESEALLAEADRNAAALGLDRGSREPGAVPATLALAWPLKQTGLLDPGFYAITNYVDHAGPGAVQDAACGTQTYDGHKGTDIRLWPFKWLKVANSEIEVVAAAPGVIELRKDGNPDQECDSNPAAVSNTLIVRHADGTRAIYGHMKSGSVVTKGLGASVAVGERLGVVASSGRSSGPHLHFELRDAANNPIDPFAGPCNPTTDISLWSSQPPYSDPAINKLTTGSASAVFPTCPGIETTNIKSQFARGDAVTFSAYFRDVPAGSAASMVVRRPDASVARQWQFALAQSGKTWLRTSAWTIPADAPAGVWWFEGTYFGKTVKQPFTVESKGVTWFDRGPTIISEPAVSSWASGRLDVFARGKDNTLQHKWYHGAWSGWESLGGIVTSAPAAVSWGSGRIDVFIRGGHNALHHKYFDGKWSAWESLGGTLYSSPAVSSWGPGRLDVFVRGSDDTLQHRWYHGKWSAWESLGGVLASDPTAVSWGPDRIDVFARGKDNTLRHKWFDGKGAGWSGWESLGGDLSGGPTATTSTEGRLHVFARGADGSLQHKAFDKALGWLEWKSLGGVLASQPAAVSWGPGRLDVFLRGEGNKLLQAVYDAGAWK